MRKSRSGKKRRSAGRVALALAAVAASCGLVYGMLALDLDGRLANLGPCAPGRPGNAGEAAGEARELLETSNFQSSPAARGDLQAGVVDPRLVAALQAVAGEQRVCVDAFKEGHFFLPGVEDGPLIPEGYGEAGGLPNTHYHGRAVDVRRVDGKPVRGNGTDPDVLDVGEALVRLSPEERPDQIIGPPMWTEVLNRSRSEGWILDEDQLDLHEAHIHLGYRSETGTSNTE